MAGRDDELAIRLTARDELSAKVKAADANVKKLVNDLAAARKEANTPAGAKRYDELRAALAASAREAKRLRAELNANERALRKHGTAATASGKATQAATGWWAKGTTALSGMTGQANIAGMAMSALAGIVGVKAVQAFKTAASETLGLSRVLGGTTEEASRLAFAAKMSGAEFATFQRSMLMFGRTLQAASQSETQAAAMTERLGFAWQTAGGKVLPLNDVLLAAAERFQQMPAGAERSAYAVKLFGRSAIQMVPFLSRGEDGIRALMEQADDFGLVIGDDMVAQFSAARKAEREFQASLRGLQVEIGAAVMPTLNALAGAGQNMLGWLREMNPAVRTAAVVLGAVGTAALLAAPKIALVSLAIQQAGGRAVVAGRAMAGLRSVGSFLMGPWGVALAAGGAALAYFGDQAADAEARVQSLAGTFDAVTGAFNAEGMRQIAETLLTDISRDDWAILEQYGITVADVTAKVAEGGEAFDAYVSSLTGMVPPMGENKALISTLQNNLRGLSKDTGDAKAAALAAAEAQAIAGAETDGLATEVSDASSEFDTYTDAVDRAEVVTTRLTEAFADLNGVTRDFIAAQGDLGAAIDAATAALDEGLSAKVRGDIFDPMTESGRKANEVLGQIAVSAEDAATKAASEGKWGRAKRLLNQAHDAIVENADAYGMTTEQAEKYANKILGIPTDVLTTLRLNTDSADTTLARWLSASQKSLLLHFGITAGGSADGGLITGPGTGTSDSIPRWLSNGEWVNRAAATSALGVDTMTVLNHADLLPPSQVDAIRNAVRGGVVTHPVPVPVAAASGPVVNIGTVRHERPGDVQAEVVAGIQRAERIRRERGA